MNNSSNNFSQVKVGSTVGVSGRYEYWLGTVEKVMKTRCTVTNSNNGLRYAVPMNLLDVKPSVFV